jgi:hypothetical protein
MVIERRPIHFQVDGTDVRGVLYLPRSTAKLACVVLAHGFSGTMDWILPSFAERFASAGLAALTFDYRHFGASGGEPRQLVDVVEQRADLRAAVDFARRQPEIDAERIALWGTSLGGSHVALAAAEDARITALVLNMPALDPLVGGNVPAKRKRLDVSWAAIACTTLQLLAAAVHDALRAALGRSPRYLAVYGEPGTAFFTDPELADNFARVTASSPTWENRVAARFLLGLPRYRKGTMERIAAPILVCLAEHDLEVSTSYVKRTVAKAKRAEVRVYSAGHFEMYHGDALEKVVADQTAFLYAHLGERADARP